MLALSFCVSAFDLLKIRLLPPPPFRGTRSVRRGSRLGKGCVRTFGEFIDKQRTVRAWDPRSKFTLKLWYTVRFKIQPHSSHDALIYINVILSIIKRTSAYYGGPAVNYNFVLYVCYRNWFYREVMLISGESRGFGAKSGRDSRLVESFAWREYTEKNVAP